MPAIRTVPLRRFHRRPARLLADRSGGVRPCGFMLEATWAADNSCGGRAGRFPSLTQTRRVMRRLEGGSFRRSVTSLATVAGVTRWPTRLRLPDHISRRRLAPPGSGRIIRRGRFSRAAFQTRNPILRDLAGRLGPSLLPSGGAHGVFALRRFAPVGGWTRGAGPAAARKTSRIARLPNSGHFCPSGPTCLLTDRARTPIDFRRGVAPPGGKQNE
jgi:hypothetical protein